MSVIDSLPDVRTGEFLPATPENAVQVVEAVRQMRTLLTDALEAATAVLLAETARQGTKTLHLDGRTVEVRVGDEIVWDTAILRELLDLGLPSDRFQALVVQTVVEKVDGRVASQLSKANPEYAQVIDRARQRFPKKPYAVVK